MRPAAFRSVGKALVGSALGLALLAGCGSDDSPAQPAAYQAEAEARRTMSELEALKADVQRQDAQAARAGTEEAACKKALLVQTRRNFELLTSGADDNDPRFTRSTPAACKGITDPATQRRLTREVTEQVAAEQSARR